jgi:hypothetical protein
MVNKDQIIRALILVGPTNTGMTAMTISKRAH